MHVEVTTVWLMNNVLTANNCKKMDIVSGLHSGPQPDLPVGAGRKQDD